MKTRFRRFGEIMKVEDQADGTILVYGVASSGARDHAGEIILPDAMAKALPDYSKFPALREMHEPSAAGCVTEAEVDADGFTNICAHVVDPVAITKVKTKTYRGFSIGGKVLKRDPTDKSIITDIRLVEISLVDSPCNPDAVLNMWKADMTTYTPAGDDVVAEAKELAKAAGTNRYKDFLREARDALIAKHVAEAGEEEEAETVEEASEEASEEVVEEPTVEEANEEPAPVVEEEADPAAKLAKALETAEAAAQPVAEVEIVEEPVDLDGISKTLDVIIAGLPAADEQLAKGMYSVGYLAEVLSSLRSLLSQVTNYGEGASVDDKIPTAIIGSIRDLGATLVMLAQEEVAVLLTAAGVLVPDAPVLEIVELAALVDMTKADEALIEKAGKRHSKADMAKIQESHDHMAALGAKCDSGNCEKVDGGVDLVAENERLSKALTDAVPHVEALTDALTKRGEEITELRTNFADLEKRLLQVESEPAAPKTAVSTGVTKAQDVAGGSNAAPEAAPTVEDFQKALNELPEAERGQILLRIALKNPHLVQPARAAG